MKSEINRVKIEIDITKSINLFKEAIKGWRVPESEKLDKKFAACYVSDRKDLNRVLKLILNGDLKGARIKARSLDTIVREQIPSKIWDILELDIQ